MDTPVRSNWTLDELVDLERYPITELDKPRGRKLIEQCRQKFTDEVSCALPGFVRREAIEAVVGEVEALANREFTYLTHRSPYGTYAPVHDEIVDDSEDDAPHLRPQRRAIHYLAYDDFASDSPLHRLYEAPPMTAFAAAVLDVPALYTAADPLMGAPVSLHYEGDELGWHCDTQEFTITVMFRPSERGGEFQYFPKAGPRDENFAQVPSVLGGDTQDARTVPFEAGTIILFRGANTLHRVTPTLGGKPRILSVFHLERTPGRIYADQFKLDTLGRRA